MATPRKRKPRTVTDESYSALEMYCIWLHEYYVSLRRAGFPIDVAMSLIIDKDSYPSWVDYGNPSEDDIRNYLEDEDD